MCSRILDVFKNDVALARIKPGIRECVRDCRNEPSKSVPRGRLALPADATSLNRARYGHICPLHQCFVAAPYSPSEHDADGGRIPQLRAIVSASHDL